MQTVKLFSEREPFSSDCFCYEINSYKPWRRDNNFSIYSILAIYNDFVIANGEDCELIFIKEAAPAGER